MSSAPAKRRLERTEAVIALLKRFGLDPNQPPDNFDAIYAYALVEYGVFKPKPVLELFRREFVREAFRQSFYRNDPVILDREVEETIRWNEETGKLGRINYDPRREVAEFGAAFNDVVSRARTPTAVKQEQQLEQVHKDLHQGIGALAARLDGLGLDRSPEESTRGVRPVHTVELLSAPPTRHEPPASPFPLVGREPELAQINEALRAGQSVLLHGMGGIGKTSTAIEAARRLRDDGAFGHVLWIEAPDATSEDAVCEAVARELGEHLVSGLAGTAKFAAVRDLLARRGGMLIVVDDPATPAIGETFVRRCLPPGVVALVTSRRRHHGFSVDVHVRPLDRDAAITLILNRAGIEATGVVGDICDVLEYHPLALVIAAGRVRAEAMPLQSLHRRLADEKARLETLRLPDAEDRDRNVRASLNVSWADLSEDQRHVLTRLAAAYADTTLELLADAARLPLLECEDRIGELVTRSLVERAGERLHLHQLVRDFGREALGTTLSSAQAYVWEAVFDYVRRYDQDLPEHHDKLEDELGNIVGTVRHVTSLLPEDGLIALSMLGPLTHDASVLQRRDYSTLRVDLARLGLRAAERLGTHQELLADMVYLTASALADQGSRDEAVRMFQQSLGLSNKLGQQDRVASVRLKLGNLALAAGKLDHAHQHYSASLDISIQLRDPIGVAAAQGQMGALALRGGHLEEAARLYGASLTLYRERGHLQGMAACLHQLGEIAERIGHNDQARRWFLESVLIERRIGNLRGIAVSIRKLLEVTNTPDDFDQALRLYRQVLSDYRKRGNLEGEADVLQEMGDVNWRRGNLEEAETLYNQSLAIKRQLGDWRGMAVSLGQLGLVTRANGRPDAARRYAEESAEHYAKVGDDGGVALCSYQLGQLAEAAGDAEQARTHYRDSLARWERLNAPEVEAARVALGRVADDPSSPV